MQDPSRRAVLAGTAAAAGAASVFGGIPVWAQAAPSNAAAVQSDIGRLRRVLVHSIEATDTPVDSQGDEVLPYAEADMEAAVRQQAGLIRLLRGAGADVVELSDALATAIDATRKSGVFAAWLKAGLPRLAADPARVTAKVLLGRDPTLLYALGEDGAYRHIVDDSTSTMWTRDSAFMTPNGIVICNAASRRRARENHLLRFAYAYSPLLKKYPVAFDAVEEGIIIEGGDAQLVDAKTLFLGVGNRTDPRAAPILAKRLNLDVLAVQTRKADFLRPRMPGEENPIAELRMLFLHLDTYFTHVAPKHALTLPFVLEQARAEDNPLSRFIRGARADTLMSEEAATASLDALKEMGRVRLYRAGSGREEPLGEVKLVDYVRALGYKLTFTGGEPPKGDAAQFQHFLDVAYPEHRRQATNVVQAAPGRVIAYAGAPATKAALEKDGVKVDTFEGRELWAWHGGPHCLTQPLERA